MTIEPGKLYGVGVGPGDPELLTLKAVRILKEVDWIFLPRSGATDLGFAARIIEGLRLDAARFRPVTLSMSRDRQADLDAYATAAETIVGELRRGKSAAWITEGDPLLYSTFVYVRNAVRRVDANVGIEIVPGITSIQAAAARVQVPIGSLDERVAVVPAAYGLEHLAELMADFGTVILLKVHRVFDGLLDRLAALPVQPEAIYVERVGTPEERVVKDLTTLRGEALTYFSLVILRSPLAA